MTPMIGEGRITYTETNDGGTETHRVRDVRVWDDRVDGYIWEDGEWKDFLLERKDLVALYQFWPRLKII